MGEERSGVGGGAKMDDRTDVCLKLGNEGAKLTTRGSVEGGANSAITQPGGSVRRQEAGFVGCVQLQPCETWGFIGDHPAPGGAE